MIEHAPHEGALTPVEEHEPFRYKQLSDHQRTDDSWQTGRQLRMDYIRRTDELVRQMTDGIEVIDPLTQERRTEKPDVVVWLDKSARPLAWFTKALWPRLAADPDTGEVPKMPDFKFVNIDRQQWVNDIDPEGVGHMDIDRIAPSIIRSLRSIFVMPKYKENGNTPAIDAAPSLLDGKTVMVVDEVYSTGRTLDYATAFFRRAFPTARVGGTYWMRGIAFKGGAQGNANLPVWYKEKSVYGRGVGNRDDKLSERSPNLTQRLGSYFLSTRLREPDPRSLQLRRELVELATHPDVPVLPSSGRDQADRDKRWSSYNGGLPKEEVIKQKNAISKER